MLPHPDYAVGPIFPAVEEKIQNGYNFRFLGPRDTFPNSRDTNFFRLLAPIAPRGVLIYQLDS